MVGRSWLGGGGIRHYVGGEGEGDDLVAAVSATATPATRERTILSSHGQKDNKEERLLSRALSLPPR